MEERAANERTGQNRYGLDWIARKRGEGRKGGERRGVGRAEKVKKKG